MHENIYRLRDAHVPGRLVNAVQKPQEDTNDMMKVLHQRFGHMSMEIVMLLSDKIDLGVKINKNPLSTYDYVAWNSSKGPWTHYARRPMRDFQPLPILVMDLCSISEETASGATMFLFVIDEVSRYKWAFLLRQKGESAAFLIKLLRELKTQYPKYLVQRLHSDQGGEFGSTALSDYCEHEGVVLQTTNS